MHYQNVLIRKIRIGIFKGLINPILFLVIQSVCLKLEYLYTKQILPKPPPNHKKMLAIIVINQYFPRSRGGNKLLSKSSAQISSRGGYYKTHFPGGKFSPFVSIKP